MQMTIDAKNLSIAEFVKEINSTRLANKNKWYWYGCEVYGNQVEIKGFGTWLQIFRINGRDYSNPMEQSVTEFKAWLENSIFSANSWKDLSQ